MSAAFFVRVKPYNPKMGCFLKSIFVPDPLHRLFTGGDGINEIPVWVKLDAGQVEQLRRYSQNDQDPRALPAFDIVTEAERMEIDAAEELARRAHRGYIQMPVVIPDGHIKARVVDATPGAREDGMAPPITESAKPAAVVPPSVPAAAPVEPPPAAPPAPQSSPGRAAALDGIQPEVHLESAPAPEPEAEPEPEPEPDPAPKRRGRRWSPPSDNG